MKRHLYISIAILLLMSGCNGPGLNEQQRKQVKEGKENRVIRKVTEAQIMEATLLKGEKIIMGLHFPKDTSSALFQAKWLYDSVSTTDSKMAQLQEAYLYSKENGQPLPAHVEFYNADSLLYAVPSNFDDKGGIWFVYLDKRSIVKSIK